VRTPLIGQLPRLLDPVRAHADAPPPAGLDAASAALEPEIDHYLGRLQAMAPESIEAAARMRGRLVTIAALREAARQLAEAARHASGPVAAPDLMPELRHDRTAAMDDLRARWAMAGLDAAFHQRLFHATGAYTRAVWLLGRLR
jgi:hypothetical protein